jgi:hypothetical protein
MTNRIWKWSLAAIGTLSLAIVALFAFLVLDSGRDKDHLIMQSASPDGKLIVELHQVITPMHGGPDTLYVAIRTQESYGEKIYSRTYECYDFSAFRFEWNSLHDLTIYYGECSASPYDNPQENASENKIWQSDAEWHGITIHYSDTHHKATR